MGSDNKPGEPTPSGGAPDGFLKPFLQQATTVGVMSSIGVGIASSVYTFGSKAAYLASMSPVVASGGYWAYAGLAVASFAIRLINFVPMIFKEKVMKSGGGLRDEIGINMRSNPYIFKTFPGKETVLFENEGDIGKYNRANRSLTHMIENFGSFLASLPLAGAVFPFPTFVCASFFAVGRVVHQTGYVSGYGGHGAGFGISLLAQLTLEGLVLLVALAGFGILGPVPAAAPALEARIEALEAIIKAMQATAS